MIGNVKKKSSIDQRRGRSNTFLIPRHPRNFGKNCTDKEKRIIEYGIKIFGTPNVLEIQHPKLKTLIRKYLNLKI